MLNAYNNDEQQRRRRLRNECLELPLKVFLAIINKSSKHTQQQQQQQKPFVYDSELYAAIFIELRLDQVVNAKSIPVPQCNLLEPLFLWKMNERDEKSVAAINFPLFEILIV